MTNQELTKNHEISSLTWATGDPVMALVELDEARHIDASANDQDRLCRLGCAARSVRSYLGGLA